MLDVFEVQASAVGSLQGKFAGEREIPKRSLYTLTQCLVWLRLCGTMGLIVVPD